MTRSQPTQADVARLAGVSQATVSHVLNGAGRIGPETRNRVQAAMSQLSYSASPAAQRLAGGRSSIIAVFSYEPIFTPDGSNFYHPFLAGIEAMVDEVAADMLLLTSTTLATGRRQFAGIIPRLSIADGCVLLGRPDDRSAIEALAHTGYPLAFVGRREHTGGVPWVAADYASATRALCDRLHAIGHQRIAYVGQRSAEESAADRELGYREGLAPGARPLVLDSNVTPPDACLDQLRDGGFTAALVDTHAAEPILTAAFARGISVPGDLSLARLGDPQQASLLTADQWSGFTIPRQAMGRDACQLVHEQIMTRDSVESRVLSCTLVDGVTISPI